MSSNNIPLGRKEGIVVQELNGEVLIYDLNVNKAYCLNETSAMVWQLCDGDKTVPQIAASLAGNLKKPVDENLVWLALDQLSKENLLIGGQQTENHFAGLSRRQVIKKVGLASLVALPVVTSLVAPVAASAASLAGLGAACTNPNDCRACANGNAVQCRNNAAVCPTGTAKCCDCS